MLHLITTPPALDALAGRITSGDDIVLQGSAVSTARAGHRQNSLLQSYLDYPCGVYAMSDMLRAFGIPPSTMQANIVEIGYEELVTLTEKHAVIHTWT